MSLDDSQLSRPSFRNDSYCVAKNITARRPQSRPIPLVDHPNPQLRRFSASIRTGPAITRSVLADTIRHARAEHLGLRLASSRLSVSCCR